MIYDYYDMGGYNDYFEQFFNSVERFCSSSKFNDGYLDYLSLSAEKRERFSMNFEIDENAYLFYLTRRYALCDKRNRKIFLNHPYFKSCKVCRENVHISTILGDLDFKFWIKDLSHVFSIAYKNRKTASMNRTLKIYLDELFGKYNGRCHEGAVNFGFGKNIVTAFMHEPLGELRFLHSFVEKEDRVLETTANIVMSKSDYYRLLRPEIVSVIPGEELYDFYNEYMEKYPKLKNMNIKQLLVDYDEIRKNPENVKIKKIDKRGC